MACLGLCYVNEDISNLSQRGNKTQRNLCFCVSFESFVLKLEREMDWQLSVNSKWGLM